MKKVLLLVFSLVMFVGCDCNEECSKFDFNSELAQWFLFQENKEIYTFKSELTGNKISFQKESFEYTESNYILEKDCKFFSFAPSEECEVFWKVIYSSDALVIESEIFQGDNYEFLEIEIDKEERSVFREEFNEEYEEQEVFTLTDSLDVNGKRYQDILSFDLEDESGTIYISKGNGIIRIVVDNETYDIE